MSVLWRPPRVLLRLIIAVICLVSTMSLYAQSEVVPVPTSEPVVSNSLPAASPEASTVEDLSSEQSVANTGKEDAIPASVETTDNAKPLSSENSAPVVAPEIVNSTTEVVKEKVVEAVKAAESSIENKAISVEVSPADEVVVKANDSTSIVMPEVIPQANEEAKEQKSVLENVDNQTSLSSVGEVKMVPVVKENTNNDNKIKEEPVVKEAENKPEHKELNEVTEKGLKEGPETVAIVIPESEVTEKALSEGAEATPEKNQKKYYFESSRGSTLAVIIVLLVFVSYYTFQAQRGKEMFIRRISGLSAIEDAVGRATEMGRGVLYVPGIADMDDIQTIAGVTILGHVSRKTAEYDTDLYAPMTRSFVMSVAQEVVKQAYLEKGRVDAYRADRINYLTDDQFGYVAGVGGIMMRDKPAACFYLGTFYAESLILAETGNSIGAIQIAGTAEPSQIPFFVAACDYTLIGEELFAASAYLSKNPREVGSLKGQDMVKVVIIIAILIGTLLKTLAATDYGQKIGFGSAATTFMEYLK